MKKPHLLYEKFITIADNNLWILEIIKKYTPVMFLTSFLKIIINVFSTYISINIARIIFEGVEKYTIFRVIITIIIIYIIIAVENYILAVINIKVEPIAQIKLTSKIREDVVSKAQKIKYAKFCEQVFFNEYHLGLNEIDPRAIQVMDTMSSVLSSFISFITVCLITSGISLPFTLFGIVYVIIDASLGVKRKKYDHEKVVAYTPDARKRGYVNRIIYQPEFAADLKIYPHFLSLLINKYREATVSISDIILSFHKKVFKIDQCQQIAGVLLKSLLPWMIIAIMLSKNLITIPEATVLVASVFTLPQNLGSLVSSISMFQWHSLNISKLRGIFHQPEEDCNNPEETVASLDSIKPFDIDLQDITFFYPNKADFHLDHIHMYIHHGEKIAFVGRNGSGKTTLANLFIRLYDVDNGSIKIGSVDIRNIPVEQLRSKITILSQNYVVYKFTIAENVLMHPIHGEDDVEKVWYALKQVGLYEKIKNLPDGIHTYISQEFSPNGVYFSGGECQKLALARIYAGQYECIILDESTSSLDPISENEIYETVFRIFKDKTVIMISHRLGTITHIDRIFYMKNGKITEEGSHRELMERHGEYCDFFNAQAEKYEI